MNKMTFQLRTDGGKCLYEQIYEHIKKEIRERKLLAGEKLPSTRFLAEYLQVARSTVDYAYGQLLSEGYIESRPCKGYFVCPIEELLFLEEESVSSGREGRSVLWRGADRQDGAGKMAERNGGGTGAEIFCGFFSF